VTQRSDLQESKRLKVFEIPIERLVEHQDNPNQQDEKTFDEIVERMRTEGFDEPIIVVPEIKAGKQTGNFIITSGHHRKRAGVTLGYKTIPGVIREGWNEDRIAIELVARNALRGNLDPHKFTKLYDRLTKRYDPAQIQKMTGLNQKKQLDALIKRVQDKLPVKAKKKLEEAKEEIKSVDDLTGILNNIFREHGSELDYGFMVFSQGGKKHVYIKIDSETQQKLDGLAKQVEDAEVSMPDFFKTILSDDKLTANVISKVKQANGAAGKAKASAKA
jgi:ParB/RepB/Spo0J family partition protein